MNAAFNLIAMILTDRQIDYNKKQILELLRSTRRSGIEAVIDYLDSSGFFLVPSSRNRHHCWRGGLSQHSLGVCNIALSLDKKLPRASVVLCALLHDICKAGKLRYDINGNLHDRRTYIRGHGRRSVKLLEMLGLELNDDERRAIRWHMGGHHAGDDEQADLKLAKKSRLWEITHKADRKDATHPR